MIISFLNQKGGVGKTTLSLNVAAFFAAQGNRVLVVDADKQGSASAWASLRDESPFQVVSMARENLAKEVSSMAADYDVTIIDGPPHAEGIARACIIPADFVCLPMEPSGFSTWASDLTVQQVQTAQEIKPNLKAAFVVSRRLGNSVIGRQARDMVGDSGIAVLDTEIESRVAFAECATMGQTIFEWPGAKQAQTQIEALAKEIASHV